MSPFIIDPRSLALFRVLIASTFLIDLLHQLKNIEAFHTDNGILPRKLLIDMSSMWNFSINLANGTLEFQYIFFTISIIFGVTLMLGYKTRFSAFMSWIMFLSLCHHNPFILNASDRLQGILMMWAVLLPVGNYYSLDNYLSKKTFNEKLDNYKFFSLTGAACLLHFASVYFFAALYKQNDSWLIHHNAVWLSLNEDYIIKFPATIAREFKELCKLMTVSALYIELLAPILLFSTYKNQSLRLVVIAILSFLQLGFFFLFEVGFFPIRSLALHSIFLPSLFWELIQRKKISKNDSAPFYPVKKISGYLLEICAVIFFILIMIFSVQSYTGNRSNIKKSLTPLFKALKISSEWTMFRRNTGNSSLVVFEGYTKTGQSVDPMNLSLDPVSLDPFSKGYPLYPDFRWRKILSYMKNSYTNKNRSTMNKNTQKWLCKRWNKKMPKQHKLVKIRRITLSIITNRESGEKKVNQRRDKYYNCPR